MRTILYLGTDPECFLHASPPCKLIHYPVIAIVPRSMNDPAIQKAYRALGRYTHLIFTSKNAVRVFFDHLSLLNIDMQNFRDKILIAIGRSTACALEPLYRAPDHIAEQETQEGIIELLKMLQLPDAHIFLPRSSLSRANLVSFLQKRNICLTALNIYDTIVQKLEPIPDLATIDEIVFTSPSTVRAFVEIFGSLPQDKILHAIGPVTAHALKH